MEFQKLVFARRTRTSRSLRIVAALLLCGLPAVTARGSVLGTATISTTQTSGPYTYTLTVHNTGTQTIDTVWFSWLDSPEKNFMSVVPTGVQTPAGWVGLTSHLGPGDGYGIEYYLFGGTGLVPGGTLTGFKFTSNESPAQLLGNVAVPGVGNLPVTTTFLYSGGAFSPNVAQVTSTVVPEPATIALAIAGGVAFWLGRRRYTQG